MTTAKTRVVAVGLFLVLGVSGCTSRMAGRAAGELLVGLFSVVAAAAIEGATRSGSRHTYEVPPPPTCEMMLAEWRETHQDPAEVPPPSLRCTPDGDWPDPEVAFRDDPPAGSADDSVRTNVASAICGGTETQREQCEAERALRAGSAQPR